MNQTPEEIIEISPDYRYAYYYDYEPYDLLKEVDADAWGVFSVANSRWTTELEMDTFGINTRLRAAMEWTEHSWNHDRAETELGKALNRAGYEYEFVNLNGGTQSYWAYVVVYWDPKLITNCKGIIEELAAWYAGDMFVVTLERKDTYHGPNDQTIETWEIEESIGCVFFTKGYEFTFETCESMLGKPEMVLTNA